MLKIGLAGIGHWGKNLARNLKELNVLASICEPNPDNPNLKVYPDVTVHTDYDDFISDSSLEGVFIATPAIMHYEMAKKALLAGKHVFIEKPICLELAQAKKLTELAKKVNKIVMVGHVLHYHPAVKKIKAMISAGEIGKLQYIYSNRLNLGKFRTEENILWSFAPHDISLILAFAQQMPNQVITTGGAYLNEQIADVTMTNFSFENGIKAHIFVSWLHPYKEQKMILVGSKGMLVFDDTLPLSDKLSFYPHKIDWQDGQIPVPVKAEAEKVEIENEEPLKQECAHFMDCISQNQRPLTDAEEGCQVLEVLNACQASLENNGQVVELQANSQGEELPYFCHPTSEIDVGVEVGNKTKVWHFSHILKGSKLGQSCNIGQNVVVGPNAIIGNQVKIQNNVSVYEGVTLEDGVFCGPSMVFTNVFNPRSEVPRMHELKQTRVKKGATLGANCTIVCGNTIGAYAMVGAGAVVTKDVPDYALVVGNPAKQTGWMCQCGVKLDLVYDQVECGSCGKEYKLEDAKLVEATTEPA